MKELEFNSSNKEVTYFVKNSKKNIELSWFDKSRNFTDCVAKLGLYDSLLLLSYCPSVIDNDGGRLAIQEACKNLKELCDSLGTDFFYLYKSPIEVAKLIIEENSRVSYGGIAIKKVMSIILKSFK